MTLEYQINIEYKAEGQRQRLSYKFETVEVRNQIYRTICSELESYEVELEYLRDNEGIILTIYNYSEHIKGEVAHIVPHSYFKIEVLDKLLEIVESKVSK